SQTSRCDSSSPASTFSRPSDRYAHMRATASRQSIRFIAHLNEAVSHGMVPEQALELTTATMKARQDRADRDVEDDRRLLAAEAVDGGQDQRQSVDRRDRREHGPDVLVAEEPQEVEVQLVRVRERV